MPPSKAEDQHIANWQSAAAGSIGEVRAAAENQLTDALRHLLTMTAEHPQLRASHEFQALERSLTSVETSLHHARTDYNAAVRAYNRRVRKFPVRLFAGLMGLRPKPLLEFSLPTEEIDSR